LRRTAEEGKADGDFCAVRQREGELRTSDLSPFQTKFRVSFRPSRKFSQKIDRIELSYIPARRGQGEPDRRLARDLKT
jgi:hypothetical protein